MQTTDKPTQAQAIIYASIGFALLLLVFVLVVVDRSVEPAFKPIKLTTGEWPPFTSQSLPDNGKIAAIVTKVMRDAGYQPDYQFMSWPNAINIAAKGERDHEIRGSFPYFEPDEDNLSERASKFYFSESLLDVEFGIFYDARHNTLGPKITHPGVLADVTVIKLDGYEYPPEMLPFITVNNSIDPNYDTKQALAHMISHDENLVIIESVEVGMQILEQFFPGDLNHIKLAPYRVTREVRLMLAKRNPNNLLLMRKFERKLRDFKENRAAYRALIEAVENRTNIANSVELVPELGATYVIGFQSPAQTRAVILPRGSRGIVQPWTPHFVDFQSYPFKSSPHLVKVKLLNGPFASKQESVYVTAATIAIPSYTTSSP